MNVFKVEFNDHNSPQHVEFFVVGKNIAEVSGTAKAFRGSREETGITVSPIKLTDLSEAKDELKKLMK